MSTKLWGAGIASEILYRKDLTNTHKILLSIITGFLAGGNSCFISNSTFADILQVTPNSASRLISDLCEKGLIEILIDRGKGNKRYISFPKKLLTDEENDTPPIHIHEDTLYSSMNRPILIHEYISNNLNNNLNTLSIESKKNSKYFDLQSETQGRFRLKNYNYIYLSFPELQNLFDLFKTHKFTNAEIKQIFFQANVQLELKKHQITSKGGLAYKYLTGHILEDALKIKKESNLVQKTATDNVRRAPDFKQTKENLSRIKDNDKSIDVNDILKKV